MNILRQQFINYKTTYPRPIVKIINRLSKRNRNEYTLYYILQYKYVRIVQRFPP